MTAANVRPREFASRWIGWAAAALLAIVFIIQLPFFFAWGSHLPLSYAFNYLWVFVILFVVTALTRTVGLRVLAVFWFVGVYPVMAVDLLIGRPLADLIGMSNAAVPGFILPLLEELIKPLPILALFWYATRRGRWQLSASDGAILGFVVGAGFAFHEDMMFGRVSGSGPGATPLSWIFPTIYTFRGVMGTYHEIWLGLVGLSIGAAFMLRHRIRLAWLIPVAAWLVVFTEHWTWNYPIYASAGDPFVTIASALRSPTLDGALVPILLIAGIIAAVLGELAILQSVARRDPLFPPLRMGALIEAALDSPQRSWARVQTLREYARKRRSAYYLTWVSPEPADRASTRQIAAQLDILMRRAAIAYRRSSDQPDGEGEPPPRPAAREETSGAPGDTATPSPVRDQ